MAAELMLEASAEAEPMEPTKAAAPTSVELDFSMMLGISLLCGVFLVFGQVALWRGDSPLLASVCFAFSLAAGGLVPLLEALPSLFRVQANIDSLMVFAAVGAASLGRAREGAVLMLLFSLSRALESFALGKTRQSLAALKEHWQDSAIRLTDDGGEEEVPITGLRLGDVVMVRPGERIPLDAVVLRGGSAVHEAAITGEPLPVDKQPGDHVYGGTLNLHGGLVLEVTSTAGESTLARLIRLVEEAQEQEALTQRVVEWTTDRYSTFVILAVLIIGVVPFLYLRQPLDLCIYRALTLLVVASPCALAIATPSALFSAITAAARRGILLKGSVHLEAAAAVRVVALDKTGTLTLGQPQITELFATGGNEERLLLLAASVERQSEHPLAQPVVALARERGLPLLDVEDFHAFTGRGVEGAVAGLPVRVGSARWHRELGLEPSAELSRAAAGLVARGARPLCVSAGDELIGLLGVTDTLRPEAPKLIRALRFLKVRHVVMLTGDSRPAAEAIGRACGLDEVRAELLPEDKLAALEELRRTHGRVIMVGDGINDAPALARADVGVAMGGIGSDLALESADVILTRDALEQLPTFLELARKSTRMVLFNLGFALAVIAVLVGIVFRSAGVREALPLPLAVLFHEGSTVLVLLNGLRLLRWRSRFERH